MSISGGTGPIRERLAAGKPLFNGWMTLGTPFTAEIMADAGADLITVDQQHGIGGNAELVACLTAARAGGVPALVRVMENDFGLIGRALDAGAAGVICPMINNAADARALVQAVKYPPLGGRSCGPYRARVGFPDYVKCGNDWTVACGQIETKAALSELDAILSTPGFDMICAGPNDLALTLSNGAHANIRAPEVLDALDHLHAKCREHNVITAIFANDADYARLMVGKGWQIVAISNDVGWVTASAKANKAIIDGASESAAAAAANIPGGGYA